MQQLRSDINRYKKQPMKHSLTTARMDELNATITACASNLQFLRMTEVLLRVLKKEAAVFSAKEHLVVRTIDTCNEVIHYYGFLTTTIADMSVLIKNMYGSSEGWERSLYGRQAVLLMVESMKAYHIYSKPVKRIIDADFPELGLRYKRIVDKVRYFKKKYNFESKLVGVRNNTIAHINQDFRVYCDNLTTIRMRTIMVCSLSFLALLKEMQALQVHMYKISTDRLLKASGKPLQYYMEATRKPLSSLLRNMPKLLK